MRLLAHSDFFSHTQFVEYCLFKLYKLLKKKNNEKNSDIKCCRIVPFYHYVVVGYVSSCNNMIPFIVNP